MSKQKTDDEKTDVDVQELEVKALPVDSKEREGNDVSSLVGSGAPMVTVRANAGCHGLSSGQTETLIQTEEVRLNIQNGNLSLVSSHENG